VSRGAAALQYFAHLAGGTDVRIAPSLLVLSASIFTGCPQSAPTGCPGDDGPAELGVEVTVPDEGNAHFPQGTQLTYAANPPASGPHWPIPAARGFYDAALDEEQWVQNLEHGYVVILFDCGGACEEALLEALRALPASLPDSAVFGYEKVIITPYDCLPAPARITLIAWGVQLHLPAFDEPAIRDFYERYLDRGPELAG
jgi:hypothetical protein